MGPGPADVAQGTVLDDRYRIDEVIGQGGMATVYRSRDLRLHRDVAVKLFPPTPDSDEVRRHEAEISVLAHVDHPGLVALHDAGSAYAGGPVRQTYIVMELVVGPTLADLLRTGPMAPAHTARVGHQLAQACATVHGAGVVHRDIKPANILLVDRTAAVRESPEAALTTGPVVKLADFGIARFADGARLTMTGTTLGTATYLSPEQASGGAVGPPTDVYALALVLLECLTGEKAFVGTVAEVAAARLTRDPPIPARLGADWLALLTRMTRRDPHARPTMDDVATWLEPLATPRPAVGATPVLTLPIRPTAPADAGHPRQVPGAPAAEPTQPVTVAGVRAAAGAGTRPRVRTARAVLGTAGVAVVVAVGLALAGAVLTSEGGAAPVREYPAVPGELGDAVDELVRSVEP